MSVRHYLRTFWTAWRRWHAADRAQIAAALSFHAVLALAPFLVLLLAAARRLLGSAAGQAELLAAVERVAGLEAATVLASLLDTILDARGGAFLTAVGVLLMLYFASEFVVQFKAAFHAVWETQPRRGIRGAIVRRLLSFGAVLGAVMAGLLVLVASLAGSIAGPVIARSAPEGAWVWSLLSNGLAFAVVMALLALLFRYGPAPKVPWRAAWSGAAFTAILFTAGNFLIGMFIGRSLLASLYGAAGVLIVSLIWIYLLAQILLLGAEFTHAEAQALSPGSGAPPGKRG